MKKIIVATDFSENSDSAFSYATFLASKFNAELLVVHIFFPMVPLDPNLAYDTIAPSTLQEEMVKSYEIQLKTIVDALTEKKIKAESELIVGSLSVSIADFAKNKKADLIIIGKTPDTSFFDRLIGSTASSVVNNTSVPVLIVPAHSHTPSFTHIVYGTELESEEKNVLARLFDFAREFHSKITLIKINADFELNVQDDKQMLKDIQEGFSKEQFAFEAIKADDVSEGLLSSVHNHKADLLVVAGHHHDFLSDLINPSKSKKIINKTDIPLLVYDIEA
ncbi:universal stress protein [Emticicia sp. BO119]|uniref:universal stress protein n=1 Tax=Emticicia sp. BO119 TaxID=2757768 RepID=UPI0015F06E1C|nr:universal stress protein [Emticicia sp. BO119]MBA4853085.1 universal stress protein [Emticicia sp. BO119]